MTTATASPFVLDDDVLRHYEPDWPDYDRATLAAAEALTDPAVTDDHQAPATAMQPAAVDRGVVAVPSWTLADGPTRVDQPAYLGRHWDCEIWIGRHRRPGRLASLAHLIGGVLRRIW